MFELIFENRDTGQVTYAITNVTLIRYVTGSEVGFTDDRGHIRAAAFTQVENLKIERVPRDR